MSARQPDGEPLRYKTARAALMSGSGEMVTRVLTVVLSIVTARVLQPGEVGILGLAVILIGIVSLIAASSETAGVITRSKGSDSKHAFAAFIVRGVVTAVLLAGLSLSLPFLASLLVEKESSSGQLAVLVQIMIWQPILELIASYPRVLLQRELNLIYVTCTSLIQVIGHVGMGVAALLMGYGPAGVAWAAVIALGLSTTILWMRLLVRRQWKREGGSSSDVWRQLLLNNSKVFAGGFIGYLNGRIDNLLVANALGPTAMSFYAMAWNASRTPMLVMQQALGFVLVPTLARIKEETERVERALSECLKFSYLLLAPACAIMFVSAPSLVEVVLGSKWLPLVPCLQIMSVTVLAGPILSKSNALLVASGRAHITGIATMGHLFVLVIAMIPMSREWGIIGASVADLLGIASLTITLLVLTPLFRRILRRELLSSVLPPIGAAVAGGCIAWSAMISLPNGVMKLAGQALLVLAVYLATLSLVGGKTALFDLFTLLRSIMRRVSVAPRASTLHP